MSLEPPRYDVDELGPLLDEFNPLSEFYVAPRYDADLRPLYEDDYSPSASEASPSASLLDVFAPTSSSTAPAHDTQQQEQPNAKHFLTNCSGTEFHRDVDDSMPLAGLSTTDFQYMSANASQVELPCAVSSQQPDSLDLDSTLMGSFIDLAELDHYLNAPDNGSPTAVVPAQSTFEAIIREDHYEDSVAVQLDHPYGAPIASSTSTAPIELVCFIHSRHLFVLLTLIRHTPTCF